MKLDKYVRITKIKSINANEKIYDSYWAEGILSREIAVGNRIAMWRMRNILHPTGRFGEFTSSKILKIEGEIVTTDNSIYEVKEVEFPEELKRTITIKHIEGSAATGGI